jgi:hypothetical protein
VNSHQKLGRQATRLAGHQQDMPSAVDVHGLVEIVGKRDLLAASIAMRQSSPGALSVEPHRKVARSCSEFDEAE